MKPIHWILLALLNLGTLALYFFGPEHPHPHAWDAIPLFYAAYGFVGCVLIIVVSKALGKALLQKREDYYDRDA
jgi:drug/metabolite transporter (DMT)-like permease